MARWPRWLRKASSFCTASMSSSLSAGPAWCITSSQLPGCPGGTVIRSIGAPQFLPAITLPPCEPKPISTTPAPPCSCRTSWPTLTMPSAAMSVKRASPMCVLCSQTIALATGPWKRMSRASVSVMCRSRRFHDSAPPCLRPRGVVPAQPLGQLEDFLVGPHPRRPAGKGLERIAGGGQRVGELLDVAVDPVAIGPIALDRDEREPLLLDEPAAEGGAPGVVLVGAVRRLAQQDVTRVADALQ